MSCERFVHCRNGKKSLSRMHLLNPSRFNNTNSNHLASHSESFMEMRTLNLGSCKIDELYLFHVEGFQNPYA